MPKPLKSLTKIWEMMDESRGLRIRPLYVEKLTDGRYAVRKAASSRASAVESTQAGAIARARKMNPGKSPDVERVRTTSSGGVDRWRKA
jgi:hypothetical protein